MTVNGLCIGRERFLVATKGTERIPLPTPGKSVAGVHSNGPLIGRERFQIAFELAEQIGFVEVGKSVVRIQRDGPLVGRQRLLITAEAFEGIPFVKVGHGIVRIQRDGPLVGRQRLLKIIRHSPFTLAQRAHPLGASHSRSHYWTEYDDIENTTLASPYLKIGSRAFPGSTRSLADFQSDSACWFRGKAFPRVKTRASPTFGVPTDTSLV